MYALNTSKQPPLCWWTQLSLRCAEAVAKRRHEELEKVKVSVLASLPRRSHETALQSAL